MLGFADINMALLLPSCPVLPWTGLVPAGRQCSMPVWAVVNPSTSPSCTHGAENNVDYLQMQSSRQNVHVEINPDLSELDSGILATVSARF